MSLFVGRGRSVEELRQRRGWLERQNWKIRVVGVQENERLSQDRDVKGKTSVYIKNEWNWLVQRTPRSEETVLSYIVIVVMTPYPRQGANKGVAR